METCKQAQNVVRWFVLGRDDYSEPCLYASQRGEGIISQTTYDGKIEDIHVPGLDVGKDSMEKDGMEDGAEGVFEVGPFYCLSRFERAGGGRAKS